MISGKAKIAGVLGWPVTHSLSPLLHNFWLQKYEIDGAYVPLAVKPETLPQVLRALPQLGFRGVNLTIPHKELALPLLDSIDPQARLIGAVNTVIITENGKLHGINTDAYGFAENIKTVNPLRAKAVVLGAGGAAKAVCKALIDEGYEKIFLTNRTVERAKVLAEHLGHILEIVPWENRSATLKNASLLVNTTSLGLQGNAPLEIDLALLPIHAIVTDIVYKPLITPLLAQAQARGNPIVDGLGMLIHQAAPGFEAWFGIKPVVNQAELRKVLLHG